MVEKSARQENRTMQGVLSLDYARQIQFSYHVVSLLKFPDLVFSFHVLRPALHLLKKGRGPWVRQRVVEAFSSVPSLTAWSFLRLIHGGFLPPPHSPDKSWAAVSPADKS